MSNDLAALERYLRTGSHEAFAEVVHCHIDWLYSAALRQVRDPHTAEDVTQATFIALARRAASLRLDHPLAPWLLQVLRYASAAALRAQARRTRHEREAAAMAAQASTSTPEPDWQQLAPALDEAVARLAKKDQQAVLLRFYQAQSLGDVGQAMGISEDAARMRVMRAVEKLRTILARQSIAVASPAALAAALSTNTTHAAPPSLVALAGNAPTLTGHASAIAG